VLIFNDEVGAGSCCAGCIEPGEAHVLHAAMPDVPAGFQGSGVIQAVSGQPVAVVVNEPAAR